MWLCPQVTFTDHGKDGGVGDGVGRKVLELDAVVVDERLHEPTCGRSEPMAMKFDEANHVTFWWAWLMVLPGWRDPLWLTR